MPLPLPSLFRWRSASCDDGRHTGPSGCLSRSEELESLDKFIFVKEESKWWIRCCLTMHGMLHLRPLKLHFQVNRGSGEAFVADRYAPHHIPRVVVER